MVRIDSVEILSVKRPTCVMQYVNKGSTLALKPWTDITRSLTQWYHWIHKMTSVLQNLRERFGSYTAPRLRKIHQIPSIELLPCAVMFSMPSCSFCLLPVAFFPTMCVPMPLICPIYHLQYSTPTKQCGVVIWFVRLPTTVYHIGGKHKLRFSPPPH